MDSDAVPVVRNLTGNALDRYRHRGELATGRLDNERLWLAGDSLRNDWETVRLTLMAQPQMEMGRIEGGTESFSEARLDARARVNAAMVAMGPTKNCVVDSILKIAFFDVKISFCPFCKIFSIKYKIFWLSFVNS